MKRKPIEMSEEETSTTFTKVLFECLDCKAHRLPPRSTSAVYNAEEFNKEEAHVVHLKVKTWNFKRAAIELTTNGELFAICPLDGQRFSDSVERTQGSSRYFAIKVANNAGKKIYLGISFKERTEAFDFLSALQEWDDKKASGEQPSAIVESIEPTTDKSTITTAFQDLSLKDGQKITLKLNLKPVESSNADGTKQSALNTTEQNTSLAPPPSSGPRRQRGQRKAE